MPISTDCTLPKCRFECWRLVFVKDQAEAEAESELLLGSWMFLRGPRIEGRAEKAGKGKQNSGPLTEDRVV